MKNEYYRFFDFASLGPANETIDTDARTVRLSFSSDEPCRRFGVDGEFDEILSHEPGDVDLNRFRQNALPLLLEHNARDIIGTVEDVSIRDGRGHALVRFGKTQLASEVFEQIRDGIYKNTSVRYSVFDAKTIGMKDNIPQIKVKWQPVEISIVAMPADPTVGVGRSQTPFLSALDEILPLLGERTAMSNVTDDTLETTAPDMRGSAPLPQGAVTVTVDETDVQRKFAARASQILEIANMFGEHELARQYVAEGKDPAEFNAEVLRKLAQRNAKINTTAPLDVAMSRKERSEYSLVNAISNFGKRNCLEMEISDDLAAKTGRSPQGVLIPNSVFAEASKRAWEAQRTAAMNSSISNASAYVPEFDTGIFVDVLRSRLVTGVLGIETADFTGAPIIRKNTGSVTVYDVAEEGTPTASALTPGKITPTPKTIGAKTDITRKYLLQTGPVVEQKLRVNLMDSIAQALDTRVLNGTAAASQCVGIFQNASVNIFSTDGDNGDLPTYNDLLDMWAMLAADNSLSTPGGRYGWLTSDAINLVLSRTPVQASGVEGNFIKGVADATLLSKPFVSSTLVPSNFSKGTSSNLSAIAYGNWADGLLGTWGGVDLLPHVNPDTGTHSLTAFLDYDFVLLRDASFVICKTLKTA